MRLYKKQAFTLIELMIAVLILSALTVIALPRITGGAFNAGINACRKYVDIINSQIELYYSSTNTWPLNIGTVANDSNYFPDGRPRCPFDKPYILVKTNDKNRVPDHIHLDRTAIKKISESILEKL
jgi:competence protein ComGC